MVQKLGKALLALSVMVPMQVRSSKQCETLCNLIITKCLRVRGNEVVDGNLSVNGTLTVGGVNFSNLSGLAAAIGAAGTTGATGPTGAAGLSAVVNSVIPFASGNSTTVTGGVVTPFTLATTGLPTTGLVMGFGDNSLLTGAVNPGLTATYGSFAFTVPLAGTLHNLWGSVDANFLVGGIGTGPFPISYTIYHSSAVNGVTNAYTPTALTATATLTSPPSFISTALQTAFGNNLTTSLPVAAGDRIVLVVAPTTAVPAATIGVVGFQAGVVYTPA